MEKTTTLALMDPQQTITYLTALFKPEEYISITANVRHNPNGRWDPYKGIYDCTVEDIIDELRNATDIRDLLPGYNPAAGAWIACNPMDGEDARDSNVTDYRYTLIESDTMPVQDQYTYWQHSSLPVAALVYSGGKSIHAIVRVDAADYDQYINRVRYLHQYLSDHGFSADPSNKNPSRYTRLPGIPRNGKIQKLLGTNIGLKSWDEWYNSIQTDATDAAEADLPADTDTDNDEEHNQALQGYHLPPIVSFCTYAKKEIPLPEELISSILRVGHKCLITGPAKSYKSFMLMNLAACLSEGLPWLGFQTKRSTVLYLNLEIDGSSFAKRFQDIYKAKGLRTLSNNLKIWNLRGYTKPLDQMLDAILAAVKEYHFECVIIDPLYKIITGDENSAKDMAYFCGLLDRITDAGASVIYCHHQRKGNNASSRALDRSSGSGVFGRDNDAILDLSPIDYTSDDPAVTAWRLEATLREFASPAPINLRFQYPIHTVDDSLRDYPLLGSVASNLQSSPKRKEYEKITAKIDQAVSKALEAGIPKVTAIADTLKLDPKTVRSHLVRNLEDKYRVNDGYIYSR